MFRAARITIALALVGTPLAAQNATPPPSVTTVQLGWLEGRWEGTLPAMPGARAEMVYQAPSAGVITGLMRLEVGGKLAVIELISLVDTPNGLEMRFRHFDGTLTAYEPTFKQAMRLVSADRTTLRFDNAVAYDSTLMSTQPRITRFIHPAPDSLIGRSEIIGDNGKPATIESVYHRVH